MVPLLSESTSLIISWSSDSLGFWPRDRMTVPSSFVVICPAESMSKALHDPEQALACPPEVEEVVTNHHHPCPIAAESVSTLHALKGRYSQRARMLL